jgi:predicted glycosyltransferase
MGAGYVLRTAASHPERVLGCVLIGPSVGLADPMPGRVGFPFDEPLDTEEGWAKYNAYYWRRDWPGFAEFFFGQVFSEPHSTKQIEDCVGWARETDGETILIAEGAPYLDAPAGERRRTRERPFALELAAAVRCPSLVIHGGGDRITHVSGGRRLAEALDGALVELVASGHCPQVREPVETNLLIRRFVESLAPRPLRREPATWTRALDRRRRVLYLSSPIGLGHAKRDVAIAAELRKLHPDVRIEWLSQDPVTRALEAAGETVHPASRFLANESKHIESESGDHDLNAFQAIRDMDEIMVANFMLFHDVVRDERFDLVVGDEAWDVDHFLFENPELKRFAFAWMTDFVGWIPMPDGGDREALLTSDYNAEMLEHVARYPRLRDRAIFVGEPDDVVPDAFGPGLPSIREWTEANYAFAGYVTGFEAVEVADREALRAELGYGAGERVCVVTVGGSGVGEHLLRRVIAAYPEAAAVIPGLRMIVVAGPRIDASSLPSHEGLDVRAYVPDLYRHLSACDLAVVQGGLTTTMELTAARRPFLYFPLRHHFEQNVHVRHRLERYRAGRCMDYQTASPDVLAEAMAAEMVRMPDYLPVDSGGAARAAALIGELI